MKNIKTLQCLSTFLGFEETGWEKMVDFGRLIEEKQTSKLGSVGILV